MHRSRSIKEILTFSALMAKNSNAFSSYVRKLNETPNMYLLYGADETLLLTA